MSPHRSARRLGGMEIAQLSGPLGAEVWGLDLARGLDQNALAEVRAALAVHKVLAFRDQELTPEQHVALTERLGGALRLPFIAPLAAHPEIIAVLKEAEERDISTFGGTWHSDFTFLEAPPSYTLLYALEAPQFGGDTAFANQILAYQELSTGMRELLDELHAVHSAAGLAALYGESAKEAPHATHPVVRTHDETGERALYVCRAFTERFTDWTREESRSVLNYLYSHTTRPEVQARHNWQAGDLVMWDNRCLLHYAVHDHGDDARVIHRTQVAGPVPV